ncbi:MAG: hypothetical protein PF572_04905 [Patescibacteria group bacterium]|jgi:hypothetical protein|nr:hypothetical protein [Patescibacteria group bacterium]
MMNKKISKFSGFILIEVLISVAIFVIFASALVSMILGSISVLQKGADYSFASNLSQEGLEATRGIRGNAWNELRFMKSALVFENGWSLAGEGTGEGLEKFIRYIDFSPIYRDQLGNIVDSLDANAILDINSLALDSIVSWQDNLKTLSVNNSVIFTNWQSKIWEQDSWLGNSGQEILLNGDEYFQSLNILADNSLSLEEISTSTFALDGSLESSAFGAVDLGIFSSLLWEENIPETCNDCKIRVQIKTASDSGGTPVNWSNTWSGPEGEDGDESDYFENSEGELININHNEDKWIKYKVIMEGEISQTPSFEKIKIYYK